MFKLIALFRFLNSLRYWIAVSTICGLFLEELYKLLCMEYEYRYYGQSLGAIIIPHNEHRRKNLDKKKYCLEENHTINKDEVIKTYKKSTTTGTRMKLKA